MAVKTQIWPPAAQKAEIVRTVIACFQLVIGIATLLILLFVHFL